MDPNELAEPFDRMLAALFPPVRVHALDRGASPAAELSEIEASGFLDALVTEAHGGAELPVAAVLQLWLALGRHAAPLAIGEAMIARAAPGAEAAAAAQAVLHAAAIAGAADKLLAMCVDYAGQRVQFGKPIGRQQALQQQLAVMAEDALAARLACELACGPGHWPTMSGAAAAKAVASEAAPRIANTAHAVHGAIGISAEFDLQLYTRSLHAWRVAGGAETAWQQRLGADLIASGAPPVDWLRKALFPPGA